MSDSLDPDPSLEKDVDPYHGLFCDLMLGMAGIRKRPVLLSITHNSVPVLWRSGLKCVTFNFGASLLDCVYGDAR